MISIKNYIKILYFEIKYIFFNYFRNSKIKNNYILNKNVSFKNNFDIDIYNDFYENGFLYIDKMSTHEFILNELQNIFNRNKNLYDKDISEDKSTFVTDKDNKVWFYNNYEGIIDFRIFNENHSFFDKFQKTHNLKKGTFEKILTNFPEVKEKINNLKNGTIVNNIFKENFCEPYMIKFERKSITQDNKKYNENFIHLDTFATNYKYYIYLNKVNEDHGPLQIVPKTHHWHIFPELKKISFFKKGKTFNLNSPEIKKTVKNKFVKLIGNAGQCIAFTGSLLHSATNLSKSNVRWTIQVYYGSNDLWSTDKKN